MQRLIFVSLVLLCSGLCTNCVVPQENSTHTSTNELPNKYVIASAHPLATQAGIHVLNQGGNAFDAAIAVTASLAVVEPYASGLGGGGFFLLHIADKQQDIMLDARETAPLAASRDMYLDDAGEPTTGSVLGALAAGIPGIPAGITHLAENYGRLPLCTNLQPAITLAKKGFVVDAHYLQRSSISYEKLHAFTEASKIFLDKGHVPQQGFVLKQTELAYVLQKICEHGAAGFYQGEIAEKLVKSVQHAGGIWQLRDLQEYKVKLRQPITGRYKNMDIVSAALPSSGGIVLMQILNMLSEYDLPAMQESMRIHVITEAMRRAYRDRAKYLGDDDFVQVPTEKLISSTYAKQSFADFNPEQATASANYLQAKKLDKENREGQDTTHFSIIDQAGNYVAATLSINYYFGSGFVPQGTGVLLNNEMDDFVIKPGHKNLWGLVGGEANAIQAGKRMLSSMTPTFLIDKNRIAILGTPGGSRIISMVLLATLAFAQGADAQMMTSLPRYHHQFLPDEIQYEVNSLNRDVLSELLSLGHNLKPLNRNYGNMHVVIWDKVNKTVSAASDPRGIGTTELGSIRN